jgi:hypothetical protein
LSWRGDAGIEFSLLSLTRTSTRDGVAALPAHVDARFEA